MIHTIQTHILSVKKLDFQRKAWLMLSALVVVAIGFVIFDPQQLPNHDVYWAIGAIALIITATWWYWVMRLINNLVSYRYIELQILSDLITSVGDLTAGVQEMHNTINKAPDKS